MTRNVCTVYIAGPLISCSLLLFVVCSVLAELWLRPWQSLSQDVVGRAHAHRTDTLGLSVKRDFSVVASPLLRCGVMFCSKGSLIIPGRRYRPPLSAYAGPLPIRRHPASKKRIQNITPAQFVKNLCVDDWSDAAIGMLPYTLTQTCAWHHNGL